MFSGCSPKSDQPTVGVCFETLQTEYWAESFDALRTELESHGFAVIEAISDGDANRQLSQIKNFLVRGVDGIIVAPKDRQSIVPAIKAANDAGVPIVCYNRPPAEGDHQTVTVVADNFALARDTVAYLVEQARQKGGKYRAAILIGDLGDENAVNRREGFNAALAGTEDFIEVVARIPTEWNQEKARAGLVNALQTHPDINFIFTSSDFLLPSISSALQAQNKWHPHGHADHVLLGGLDGDATAYQLILEGYMDATGVQDLYFEAEQSVQALLKLQREEPVEARILDPGFVIHRDNHEEMAGRTWGARVFARNQAQ